MKILIAFGGLGLGDIALVTPFLQRIKQRYPSIIIDVMLTRPELIRAWELVPEVRRALFKKGGSLATYIKLYKELKKENYDKVYLSLYQNKLLYLLWLVGIKDRIGVYINPKWKTLSERFLTKGFIRLSRNSAIYEVYELLFSDLLGEKPLQRDNLSLKIPDAFTPPDKLKNVVLANKINIVIDAGTSIKKKTLRSYPYYIELISALSTSKDINIILMGLEVKLHQEIETQVREKNPSASLVNLAGKTNIIETAYLLSKSQSYIGNDSGLLHVASAFPSVLSVGIYGPSPVNLVGKNSLVIQRSPILECMPCNKQNKSECPVGTWSCMLDIEPKALAKKIITRLTSIQ